MSHSYLASLRASASNEYQARSFGESAGRNAYTYEVIHYRVLRDDNAL